MSAYVSPLCRWCWIISKSNKPTKLYHIIEVALCELSWPPRMTAGNVEGCNAISLSWCCANYPGPREGGHYISRSEQPKIQYPPSRGSGGELSDMWNTPCIQCELGYRHVSCLLR